jgi:hypothetical protein
LLRKKKQEKRLPLSLLSLGRVSNCNTAAVAALLLVSFPHLTVSKEEALISPTANAAAVAKC